MQAQQKLINFILLLGFLTVTFSTSCFSSNSRFEIQGVLESEASIARDFNEQYQSDAKVAKIEIEASKAVNQNLDVTFLYKFEDETAESGELDKAFVSINELIPNLDIDIGRLYLYEDFFETAMVSDALTQELIELRMEGLRLNYHFSDASVHLSLYKSPLESTIDHKTEWVVDFTQKFNINEKSDVTLKLLYTSNIVDSQHLASLVESEITHHSDAAGIGINLHSPYINLTAQCVSALRSLDQSLLVGNNQSKSPLTCQLELGRTVNLLPEDMLAIGYQHSEQAQILGFPASKIMASYRLRAYDNLNLAFELAHSQDYSQTNGGTGKTENSFTAQIALEF